ncbi:MAG: hypothetical protein OHK0028_11990 [Deltaproteobacteria bacterium]
MERTGNRVTAWVRGQVRTAHEFFEATMADVSSEMAHWAPPGVALPIGAAYAHFVLSEDWVVNVLFRRGGPLFLGPYAGKTGASEIPPDPGAVKDWSAGFAAWSRKVRIDLPAFRTYAQAVYASADTFLSNTADEELDRQLDLSAVGMGTQSLGFVLNNAVLGHAFCHCGEISALKGVLGKKGYPM